MVTVLILTCLASIAPDDCTRQTALDVREFRAMPMECAMAGLSVAASEARGEPGESYPKIICAGR